MIASPQVFWKLTHPDSQHLGVVLDRNYTSITCPTHPGHQRGQRQLGNISIKIAPSGVKDFTWSWGSDILVSQSLLYLFAKHQVTGFVTEPATVRFPKSSKEPPQVFELIVTGWGGFAAAEAGVKLVDYCPDCRKTVYTVSEPSRLIDPAAWDGSDLFLVWPLPGYRFVSDRLATILRSEKVTGVKLVPAPDIPLEKGDEVRPGRIASAMPPERARELRERFGIE